MSKSKLFIRLILFIFVLVIFSGTFYFYYKNSRASSPLTDEEYMEQLNTLSKRYKIVSPPVPSPTATSVQEGNNQKIISKISEFFTKIIESISY